MAVSERRRKGIINQIDMITLVSPFPVVNSASDVAPLPRVTRVAVIGVTGYSQTHLRMLSEIAEAQAVEVVSVVAMPDTPEALLAGFRTAGVRIYSSFQTWLLAEQGKFDVCCIPTPIHLHAPMTLAVIKAQGSVLVEKPLAASLAEITALTSAKPAPGRFVAVGFQDLYTKATHSLKKALLDGRYGRLRRISVIGLWPRPSTYYNRNHWAGKLKVGDDSVLDSPLNNALSHFVMLALFLAGSSQDEAAVVEEGAAEVYRARPIESFDTVAMRLQLQGGAVMMINLTHACSTEQDPVIAIECERANIRWTAWKQLEVEEQGCTPRQETLPDTWETRREMFAAVCRQSRGEESWVCPPSLAARHAQLVLALHQNVPIGVVRSDAIRPISTPDGEVLAIDGIESVWQDCAKSGLLPSELGVHWASSATRFSPIFEAQG